jgi:hypothetical protein
MSVSNSRVLVPVIGGALFGCVAFGIVGFAGGYSINKGTVAEVQRAPTAAELEDACAPDLEAAADDLGTAQAKVAELERETATKERRSPEAPRWAAPCAPSSLR